MDTPAEQNGGFDQSSTQWILERFSSWIISTSQPRTQLYGRRVNEISAPYPWINGGCLAFMNRSREHVVCAFV
jgi:hypothetical protein